MRTSPGETYDDVRQASSEPELRVWLSGTVVYDVPLDHRQRLPFANWTRSQLRYTLGIGDAPPEGYTGINYVTYDPNLPASTALPEHPMPVDE